LINLFGVVSVDGFEILIPVFLDVETRLGYGGVLEILDYSFFKDVDFGGFLASRACKIEVLIILNAF
jgi:hypothetical protein